MRSYEILKDTLLNDHLGGKGNSFQVRFLAIFLFWFKRENPKLYMTVSILPAVFKGEWKWASFMHCYINRDV